jgi:uncharacterized protein DUF4375
VLRRLHVTRSRFAADEDAILTEAVMNTQTAADPLTLDERVVYDADEYLGGVMMDGHILTLCNKGLERINDMGVALERIGASRERALLEQALLLWKEHGYADFDEVGDALLTEFDALDQRFFAAASGDDSLELRIKHYVREHLDAFIVLE